MKRLITFIMFSLLALSIFGQGTGKDYLVEKPFDGSYGGKTADTAILATDYTINFTVPANSGNDFRCEFFLDVDSIGGTPNYTATHQKSLDNVNWTDISSVSPVTSADTAFYITADTITSPYNRIKLSADSGAQKIKIKTFFSFRVLNNIKK